MTEKRHSCIRRKSHDTVLLETKMKHKDGLFYSHTESRCGKLLRKKRKITKNVLFFIYD